ncbi:MAG: hypothetical protein QXX36_03980 [Candidatus Rehaiarchaeum fermentans]|nr:hypothetical protein [Candidatus Rehaiarchaeum fermentans]
MIRRAVEVARTLKGMIKMGIEINKLVKKYKINNNEIVFKVAKNGILQLLDKKEGF